MRWNEALKYPEMADAGTKPIQTERRLDTWKQIAEYLKKDVRTVIRWEKDRSLPVHRIPGQKRSSVYAWTSEIDLWLHGGADEPSRTSGPAEEVANEVETAVAIAPGRSRSLGRALIALVSLFLLAVGASVLAFWPRPGLPHLGKSVQITSDGRDKGRLAVGGDALFFESAGGLSTITRIDQSGRLRSFVPFARGDFRLQDVSPDGSKLLAVAQVPQEIDGPLWVIPSDGGPPRRLADLNASTAAWSPDGRQLAYVTPARELYLASSEGAKRRRLTVLSFRANNLRWSPDARRLRLVLADYGLAPARLWEVRLDGSGPRRLLPGWSRAAYDQENDGRWSPDGKFFVFGAFHNGISGLWAIRERSGWLDWRGRGPFQLTASLHGVWDPVWSRDGKRLFATEIAAARGDLMRYDPGARSFAAYPDRAGLSAGHTSFSPDGKQVAYVAYPQMSLWKMNADGTGRQVLADNAVLPQWSPDGHRIAYMGLNRDYRVPTRIHVISAEGGTPQQPVQWPEWQGVPTWTADGSGLIFGENDKVFPIRESCSIHLFDFKSGKTSDLPGSTGLWTARASPTGRYIGAVTRDNRKLVLYDVRAAAWAELASFSDSVIGANPTWSSDGRFVYFDSPESPDPAIYRVAIPGKRLERVASLKGIQRVRGDMGLWIGLTPDNLPLILRAVQPNQVYAWDWIAL
jgi:Tol biopolymer transport system component